MWTFFVMFLSVATLLFVFIRRMVLVIREKNQTKKAEPEKSEAEEIKEEMEAEGGDISRKEKSELTDLLKTADNKVKYGKEDEAIKLFVRALAIDACNVEAQNKLAMLYLKKEMYGSAAALFKQLGALTEEPSHYSHLGFALYQQNQLVEAREAYSKALAMDDSRPQRYVSLAQVYRSMEQLQNAIIAVRRAVAIDEENLDYIFLLADLQVEIGDHHGAVVTLDFLLEKDPEDEDAKKLLRKVKREIKAKAAEQ